MSLNCPCCNSNEIVHKAEKFGYKIMLCKDCTVEFVYPTPTKEELERFYDSSNITTDIKDQIRKTINTIEKDPNSPLLRWYAKVLEIGKTVCKKSTLDILELGSSYGSFLHFANLQGHNAVGTESTKTYATVADGIIKGRIVHVENNDYEKYFKDNSFDLIYLEHVFEHIDRPGALLDKLRKLLRANGIIFVFVPNHSSLLARIYGTKWSWVHPPAHLFHYNRKSLSGLLKQHGYEVIRVCTGDYLRTMHGFYSLHNITNKAKARLNKYFNTNYQFATSPAMYKKKLYSLDLIPFWILLPLLKALSKANLGNELVIISYKKSNS